MSKALEISKKILFYEWARRLTGLLVCIFLLQYLSWIVKEDGLWLPETIQIVKYTLYITMLIHIAPKIHYALRGLLYVAVVLGINMSVLDYHYVSFKGRSLLSFATMNLNQLIPYLWFSFVACILFLMLIWWAQAKWRIYLMIIVSVIALAVKDSFSSMFLWQELAVVLFCGLSLVIVCHFQNLKRKAPTGWDYLASSPFTIALPVAGLISLTILIGSFAPEIRPLLTDPYTAWRKMHGEAPAFTTGKGFEVSPTNSADSSSGYSRNDQSLGAGFNFDFTPIMTVNSTQRSYWRGETRALYNGKGWEVSAADRRSAAAGVGVATDLPDDPRFGATKLKTVEVKQTFTFPEESPYAYPVLFAAFPIQKLETVDGEQNNFDIFRWSARQGEIRVTRKEPIKEYVVTSKIPVLDEAILKTAPADWSNKSEFGEYLQLPSELPARVRKLAEDWTKDSTTPYDKAKAIEKKLSTLYPYTNKPDLSKGSSKDFVDRFLFEIKEGYCDYFSTSMVVLARAVGLPARWVKGYAPGEEPFDEESVVAGRVELSSGEYTVRNADAHSWVEIYLNGMGWIPFEPTSGFVLPTVIPPDETVVEPLPVDPAVAAVEEEETSFLNWGYISGAVLILVLAAAAWRFKWIQLLAARSAQTHAVNYKQKVIVECEKMLRFGKRKGYVRSDHETVREAARRWSLQSKWLADDLDQMLRLFEKAKYSNSAVTEQDYENTVKTVMKLRTQMQ